MRDFWKPCFMTMSNTRRREASSSSLYTVCWSWLSVQWASRSILGGRSVATSRLSRRSRKGCSLRRSRAWACSPTCSPWAMGIS